MSMMSSLTLLFPFLSPKPLSSPHLPIPPSKPRLLPPLLSSPDPHRSIADTLLSSGASPEDALAISSNCPNFAAMVVGDVEELDEHALWGSWGGDGEMDGFGEKVRAMVRERGFGGVLPFLESLGIGFSSARHIAGFVSASQSLPGLIDKVKYIREIMTSESDHEILIGKNARRMMMHLSIPIDEDIQLTLSFFEKMAARRGGLEMFGFADTCFPFLVESFPRLLLLPVDTHLKPLFEFLQSIGVPKGNIKRIFLLFPPILFYDVEKGIKPKLSSIEQTGASEQVFGRMLSKYPWILSKSIQKNYKEILSFFEMGKIPKSSVDRAVKGCPHLLGCSTDKIKAMVEQLGALGVRNKLLAAILSSSPQLFLRKPHEFLEIVSFMEEIGFDDDTIGRILCRCPEIFASNIETTLRKKINILVEFGITTKHLRRVIQKYPELLVSDVSDTLLPRMRYLMEQGLSRRDVASMLHRFSPLLGYSVEVVLKPKLEFLLNTMERPLKEIVEYPRYFSYSLEKKIKPRHHVIKGRNIQCSLKDMLGKNNDEFAEEYMGIGRMLVLPSHQTNASQ